MATPISVFPDLFRFHNYAVFQTFATNEDHYLPHINRSREMILSQAERLNKTSKVVVMGPGALEPLAEIADRCGELILVNYDETALQHLSRNLSRSNVKVKKMEFTAGLYERMEEFMRLAVKENWSAEQFFKVIVSFFATYRPTTLLEDPVLKDVDYVISSLVASQFTIFTDKALVQFFEKQFHITFEYFLSNLSESERVGYGQAEQGLSNHLFVHYAKSLGTVIKPTGRIYLSDTISVVQSIADYALRGLVQVIKPMLDGSNLIKIEEHYHVLESKKWQWLARPSTAMSYEVLGYLLEKKHN